MAIYNKTCSHCGRPFTTKTWWAKFCSGRCKLAAWRKAKRQAALPMTRVR